MCLSLSRYDSITADIHPREGPIKDRLFCLLLVLATPAFAAISQVQSKANWSGGAASCGVMPATTTTRNHLVVFWTTWTSTSTLTATVSDGTNSYLSAVGPTLQTATSTPTSAQLFYAVIGTGTTNTITVNFTGGSASTSGCVFAEYMGLDTMYPLDSVSAGYSYSLGTAMDSGTAAPANLLVFGGGTTDTGTAGTTGLPWSVVAGPPLRSL